MGTGGKKTGRNLTAEKPADERKGAAGEGRNLAATITTNHRITDDPQPTAVGPRGGAYPTVNCTRHTKPESRYADVSCIGRMSYELRGYIVY